MEVTLMNQETLLIERPDGIIDRVVLNDSSLELTSVRP
jgi:hypothetical protein